MLSRTCVDISFPPEAASEAFRVCVYGSRPLPVTVLNRGALSVACVYPDPVYEGSADFALDCSASGAPAGSAYDYVWTARGSWPDTALLIAGADGPAPTFAVPDEVAGDETYEYLLTVSAENAEAATPDMWSRTARMLAEGDRSTH